MENQTQTQTIEKVNELPSVFDALIDIITDKVKAKLGATPPAPPVPTLARNGNFTTEEWNKIVAAINDAITDHESDKDHLSQTEIEDIANDVDVSDKVDRAVDDIDIDEKVRTAVRDLSFSVTVD